MRVSHYFEFESVVTGGIDRSVTHQRKMFAREGVEYTERPTLDCDVLHLNVMGPRSVFFARRANKRDIPVVIHTHVTAEDFGDSFRFTNALAGPLKPYLEIAYGLGDLLICPSEHNRQLLETYTGVEKTVVTNGVDRERLDGHESLRSTFLRRYDLSPPVVFVVGHVIKRKGLRAFVETAKRLPDLDFVWFGPLDISLKGRSTKRLIERSPENCTFTGYVEDIRGAYAAGDVFFFPTREESEGIALLEAMSVGIPAVVRDIPAFSWLNDGHDCLKASHDFHREIRKLTDESLRAEIGRNAAKRMDEFALSNVSRELLSRYRWLV